MTTLKKVYSPALIATNTIEVSSSKASVNSMKSIVENDKKKSSIISNPKPLTVVTSKSSCGISPLRLSAMNQKRVQNTQSNVSDKQPESLDLARIVSKESTVLLKDIYDNIQLTLKKYDEIIREHQENRQKNESLRNSQVQSMSDSIKKKNLIYKFDAIDTARSKISENQHQQPVRLEEAFQKHIQTLREQRNLLLLMLQNASMQEQVFTLFKDKHQSDENCEAFPVISNIPCENKEYQLKANSYSKLPEDQANQAFKQRQIQIAAELEKFGQLKKGNKIMLKMLKKKLNLETQSEQTLSPYIKSPSPIALTKINQSNTQLAYSTEVQYKEQNINGESVDLIKTSPLNLILQNHTKEESLENDFISKKEKTSNQGKKFTRRISNEQKGDRKNSKTPASQQKQNKQVIEFNLNKNRVKVRRNSPKSQNQLEIPSIGISPISNVMDIQEKKSESQPKVQFRDQLVYMDETNIRNNGPKTPNLDGYAQIHNKKKSLIEKNNGQQLTPLKLSERERKNSENNSLVEDDFSKRNQIWKERIVEKIKQKQEYKVFEEMRECTFKPDINRVKYSDQKSQNTASQSNIIKADSTQSDLQKDLKEIVQILDEFEEFKQILVKNLPQVTQSK